MLRVDQFPKGFNRITPSPPQKTDPGTRCPGAGPCTYGMTLARIFHEMDLLDLQGAEPVAVVIYDTRFWNAADQVKAFRPKG